MPTYKQPLLPKIASQYNDCYTTHAHKPTLLLFHLRRASNAAACFSNSRRFRSFAAVSLSVAAALDANVSHDGRTEPRGDFDPHFRQRHALRAHRLVRSGEVILHTRAADRDAAIMRVALEDIAVEHYPMRLRALHVEIKKPSHNQKIRSLVFKIFVFFIMAAPFVGSLLNLVLGTIYLFLFQLF